MAAGEGEELFRFNLRAVASCEATGGKIACTVTTDLSEAVQFSIIGTNSGYTDSVTTNGLTSHNFTQVPNDVYLVSAAALYTTAANDEQEIIVNCGGDSSELPVDDLTLTVTVTHPTEAGLADGTATFNIATSYLPFRTALDGFGFTEGKTTYLGLKSGAHVAYAVNTAGFVRQANFTLTDPVAPPPAPNSYYAVGGTLPNPVNFNLSFAPDYLGTAKQRHFLEAEIYSGDTLLATTRQRIRNGQVQLDVAAFLKRALRLGNTASLLESEDEIKPFSLRYREAFNGTFGTWKIEKEPRLAVQAALPEESSYFTSYVVRAPFDGSEENKFLTSFAVPLKWACHGTFLSAIIDKSLLGTALYFERSYYASDHTLVERRSTLIPETHYGKLLRLQITDDVLPCADYIDAVITDVFREMAGICGPELPPPISQGVFDNTFDFTFE